MLPGRQERSSWRKKMERTKRVLAVEFTDIVYRLKATQILDTEQMYSM